MVLNHTTRSRNGIPLESQANFELPTRALRESVRFKPERLAILATDPSSRWSIVWFSVSCYFPVLTACLSPVSNMISVACLVNHWRMELHSGTQVHDPSAVRVLNIISLVMGFIANFVLLLNFSGKVGYVRAQVVCIFAWTVAVAALSAALIICTTNYYTENLQRTIGYWYSVITAFLYLFCVSLLSVHFFGYYRKKYAATFNLLDNERLLMTFTFVFAIWFLWGSALFASLLDLTYGEGLYFCIVSVLTIGLGDIYPDNVASMVTILIYSILGVLILGLLIVMITTIISSSSGPIFFFYNVEIARHKLYQQLSNNPNVEFTNKMGFDQIQFIRKRSRAVQRRNAIILAFSIFVTFIVLGALVLYFAESWNYFQSFYFCILTLITIGYGNLAPKTGCGRAFYVIWCICAVPLMTVLISTIGDSLFEICRSIDSEVSGWHYLSGIRATKRVFKRFYRRIIGIDIQRKRSSNRVTVPKAFLYETADPTWYREERGQITHRAPNETFSACENLPNDASLNLSLEQTQLSSVSVTSKDPSGIRKSRLLKVSAIKRLVNYLNEIDSLSEQDSHYQFSYEQWMRYLEMSSDAADSKSRFFWISKESPLRYPLHQSIYLSYRLNDKLSKTLDSLLEDLSTDPTKLISE